MKVRRILLFGLAGSLAICALFAIYVVITSSYNALSGRILLSTLSIGFYSLTGLCCTPHLEGDSAKKWLAYFGITVSVIGLLFACVTNWIGFEGWSGFFFRLQFRFFFVVMAITVAHISLLLMIKPRNSMVRFVQNATSACITAVGAFILFCISVPEIGWAVLLIPIAVLAILDVLGSIITPVLHAASKV